ncbi:MAG: hypothetical protein ABWX74_20985 [Aeromicrobium sp.]
MSDAWTTYVDLLQESAGLAEAQARAIAEAHAAYEAEARRLGNERASAERRLGALRDRNTRLQVSVRDLTRSLGVVIPAGSGLPPLEGQQLHDAVTSAEYDVEQLRRSVEGLKQQRVASAAPVLPAPLPPTPAAVPVEVTSTSSRLPVLVGAALGLVLLVVLLVVVVL